MNKIFTPSTSALLTILAVGYIFIHLFASIAFPDGSFYLFSAFSLWGILYICLSLVAKRNRFTTGFRRLMFVVFIVSPLCIFLCNFWGLDSSLTRYLSGGIVISCCIFLVVYINKLMRVKALTEYPPNIKIQQELQARILDKKSQSTIMLVIIFTIVGFGAFFSIGTVALNEYRSVKELNDAVRRLSDETNDLKDLRERSRRDYVIDSINLRRFENKVSNIQNLLSAYKDIASEKAIAERLKLYESNKLQWDQIIMRVSLAILTVFLVQIFFNVYKYHQVQTNYLENKLEALRLFALSENEEEQKQFRKTILSNINKSPGFGKDPSSPIDQVIKMAEKINDKAKKD